MKKRALSLLLAIVLVLGFTVPTFAAAGDYQMALAGTSETVSGKSVITFELKLQGAKIGSTASVLLKLDATKLQPCRYSNAATLTFAETKGLGTITGATAAQLFKDDDERLDSCTIKATKRDGYIFMSVQPEMGQTTEFNNALLTAVKFRLELLNGTTAASLDSGAMSVLKLADVNDVNQDQGAVITDGDGNSWEYETTITGDAVHPLAKPVITVDGKELPGKVVALEGIDVSLNKSTVAVPTAGKTDTTVTATAAPNPSDATLPTDVKYSIDPAYTGVAVNATSGVVTVSPSAAAGSVTVKATSASASKSGTATLTLTKDAAAVNAVKVTTPSNKTVTVTLNANGTAPTQQNVTVSVTDQYGAAMSDAPTVTGLPAGASWSAGKLTFTGDLRATATAGVTVTFTVGSKSDTLTLKVNKAAAPAAPNVTAVKTTTVGGSDGKITGVNTTMEWKKSTDSAYTAVTGTEITGLTKGDYNVRVKETDFANAGTVKTVSVGEPGKTDTPTVSVAPATLEIAEGGNGKLTATVTPATGTITYKWYKDNVEVSGQTTNELTVTEAGTYKVEVTRQAAGETVSDAATATATVTVKSKATITVTKKTASVTLSAGPVSGIALTSVADVTPAAAASKLSATIVAYEKVTTPAEEEGGTDTVEYKPVSTLESGKTYLVGFGIAALDNDDDYSFTAVSAPAKPTTAADEANFVTVTVPEMVIPTAPSGYTVTYAAGEHGTLTGAAKETVSRGGKPANVPAVQAAKGYRFVGWSSDGVTIVDPTTVSISASTTFTAMYELATDPYISGDGNGYFRPNSTATRAELATMLARLSKDFDPEANYDVATSDMSASAWYLPYMKYAIHAGIMSGYEDGSYKPTAEITRGEFAKMLACYLGLNLDSTDVFADATGWAAPYINALKKAGIVRGYEDGTFRQNNKLTRAEAVTMINKAVELSYKAGTTYEKSFTDVSNNHWAYSDIIAAANTPASELMK